MRKPAPDSWCAVIQGVQQWEGSGQHPVSTSCSSQSKDCRDGGDGREIWPICGHFKLFQTPDHAKRPIHTSVRTWASKCCLLLPSPGENCWLLPRKSYRSSQSWVVTPFLTVLHMLFLFHVYWLFASVSFLTASLGHHSWYSLFSSALFLSPPFPFSIYPFTSFYMCSIS